MDGSESESYERLLFAMRSGSVATFRTSLKKFDANPKTSTVKATLLLVATYEGRVDCVRLLVESGFEDSLKLHDASCMTSAGQHKCLQGASQQEPSSHHRVSGRLSPGGFDSSQVHRESAGHQKPFVGFHILDDLNPAFVKAMRNLGISLPHKSANDTALMIAAHQGHNECIRVLLKGGAAPDTSDVFKRTALMLASVKGHADAVRELLQGGASVNAMDDGKRTALMDAASIGSLGCVTELLRFGANTNMLDQYFHTALLKAVKSGCVKTVEALLQYGASPDAMDPDGKSTALMIAICHKHYDIVQVLLDAGANPNVICEDGLSAMMLIAKSSHSLQAESNEPDSCTTCLKALLKHKVDVNLHRQGDRRTALMMAAEEGCLHCVKALIANGAILAAVDHLHRTALHFASIRGCTHVMQELLESYRVVDCAVEEKSLSQLLHAVIKSKGNSIQSIEVLVENGGDLNAVNGASCTLLTSVLSLHPKHKYQNSIIMSLLRLGADPNKKGSIDPSHYLSYEGTLFSPIEVVLLCCRQNLICTYLMMLWYAGSELNHASECFIKCAKAIPPNLKEQFGNIRKRLCTESRALKDICRVHIRRNLGSNVIKKIDSLPIPMQTQEYLQLPELDVILPYQ